MEYFKKPENVARYMEMVEGFDGRDLVEILKNHLPFGSTLLELGMGPGKDLDLLALHYVVTGSDHSPVFLDLYRRRKPEAELLQLDAVTLETDKTFDCIYSNKVLHHLQRSDLHRSFARQREMLNDGGYLMHSFWYGDKEEEFDGLRFLYYNEDQVLQQVGPGFVVAAKARYKEMETDDSFYLLLRKV